MSKKLILATAAAILSLSGNALYAETTVSASGYINTIVLAKDTLTATNDRSFSTASEIDLQGNTDNIVTTRIDLDITDTNTHFEQAFLSWVANDQFTLSIGRLNNPLGMEKEDTPSLLGTISHGLLYQQFDNQTKGITGNNIEGVTGTFDIEVGQVTLGVLNELNGVNEKNSYLVSAAISPIENIGLEATYITQEDPTTTLLTAAGDAASIANISAGSLFDINATYTAPTVRGFSLSAEFATGTEVLDILWGINSTLALNDRSSVTARYESLSFSALPTSALPLAPYTKKDITQWTVAGKILLTTRLEILAELSVLDNGIFETKTALLEAILTLGEFE